MKLCMYEIPEEKKQGVAFLKEGKWFSVPALLSHLKTVLPEGWKDAPWNMISFLGIEKSIRDTLHENAEKTEPLPGNLPPLMPFQPRSFRDFLLQDEHFINSSRGYVKKFLPHLFPVVRMYEKVTGRVFPRLKPGKLWYRVPVYYMGNHLNFITSGQPVAFPSYSAALDYELEMGAVLAKPIKNATPEEAREAIGGFVVVNDFSARDVQKDEMEGGLGPMKAKHFINGLSHVVVTADEIFPYMDNLTGEVRINGNSIVKVSSSGNRYSIEEAVAYASLDEQLYPGELLATGTWSGGCALENEHWVKPGDLLELTIDRIGTLATPIE